MGGDEGKDGMDAESRESRLSVCCTLSTLCCNLLSLPPAYPLPTLSKKPEPGEADEQQSGVRAG